MIGLLFSPLGRKLAALVAVLFAGGLIVAAAFYAGQRAIEREEMDRRLEALRRGEEIRREVDALDDSDLVDGILRQPR